MQIHEGFNAAFLRHDQAEEELVQVFPGCGQGGCSHGGWCWPRGGELVRKKQVGWGGRGVAEWVLLVGARKRNASGGFLPVVVEGVGNHEG
jgi:hypothetical protein